MAALKVRESGALFSVDLPKAMLSRMQVADGDTLFAVETPDGLLLSAHDPEIARQVELGQRFMDKYAETYKRLAE